MKNMFFYTRKQEHPVQVEGEEKRYLSFKDGINISKVIRCISLENGHLLVLLDDIHQRKQPIEVRNKQGKVTAIKNEMGTFQSEIYLTEQEDIDRFYKLTTID